MKRKLLSAIALSLVCMGNLSHAKTDGDSKINYKEISRIQIDADELSDAQKVCLDVVSSIDQAAVDSTVNKEKPKHWSTGILTQITASQVSLTNWAEGGSANISLNALIDANANYANDNMIWDNRLKLSYGFIQSFEQGTPYANQFKKSDDRILLDSKWGYSIIDRLYASALINFRTQFTPTYDAGNLQSRFMAPGYFSVGIGANYKPFSFMSINLSPLTGNFVIVTEKNLRETYGNKENQAVRTELGAQLKVDVKYKYKNFSVGTNLTLFSDYLNKPENIQVYWDVDASLSLAKYFTITLRTNLIYDDNIKIADKNGVKAARVQFKEIVGLGFTYTFGQYVKAK